MIRFMVGILRDVWMWWCRMKEQNNGVAVQNWPFIFKLLLVIQQYSLCGHLLLVAINRYGIVDVIGVIEC